MPTNPYESPKETPGREAYYEAALIGTSLICDVCSSFLDPDDDLGPNHSFQSDSYYVLLGDEAFRRGWLVEPLGRGDFKVVCPACARLERRPSEQ